MRACRPDILPPPRRPAAPPPCVQYCDKGSLAEAIRVQRFRSRRSGQVQLRAVLLTLQDVAR